jgi:hypothetical protein
VDANIPAGTVNTVPGVDNPNLLQASPAVGSSNNLGPDTNPFPQGAAARPGGFALQPNVKDTIFRTAPLSLKIAGAGTVVDQSTGASNDGAGPNTGPEGSQNTVLGASGGQANLFGNIPGKTVGIDVTVSLETRINSILRSMDPDNVPLITGGPWTSTYAGCRQAFTGAVQNYIPAVHLVGGLKIAPGITSDGHLRIAKATLATSNSASISLAACLMPYSLMAAEAVGTSSDTVSTYVPGPLPTDETTARPTPENKDCNTTPTKLVADAPVVYPLPAASFLNGYTTSVDGSKVSVAGDLSVSNVSADILIGDV